MHIPTNQHVRVLVVVREDGEPGEHGPHPVLLPHVVRACFWWMWDGKGGVLVYMHMTNGGRGRIGFVHAHIYTHPHTHTQINEYIKNNSINI